MNRKASQRLLKNRRHHFGSKFYTIILQSNCKSLQFALSPVGPTHYEKLRMHTPGKKDTISLPEMCGDNIGDKTCCILLQIKEARSKK